MPTFDGFHRLSPLHCDHNRGVMERCDQCALGARRTYAIVHQGNDRFSVVCLIVQGDDLATTTLHDLTQSDLYDLTSQLGRAGWEQSTNTAA